MKLFSSRVASFFITFAAMQKVCHKYNFWSFQFLFPAESRRINFWPAMPRNRAVARSAAVDIDSDSDSDRDTNLFGARAEHEPELRAAWS